MRDVSVVTPPAAELLTAAEARLYLRSNTTREDAWLANKIREIRQEGEAWTGRAWLTQTLLLRLDAWPGQARTGARRDELADAGAEDPRTIYLERPPVQSVEAVRYYDADGTLQTLDASTYFAVVGEDDARVVLRPGETWPVLEDGRPFAVEIEYVAGYGAERANVPGPYVSGFELVLGSVNLNREEEVTGTITARLQRGLETLWGSRRLHPIG